MKKGEKLELSTATLDPNNLKYVDLGKDQYGRMWCTYLLKIEKPEKEQYLIQDYEFEQIKEFAEINDLLRKENANYTVKLFEN